MGVSAVRREATLPEVVERRLRLNLVLLRGEGGILGHVRHLGHLRYTAEINYLRCDRVL